MGRNFIVLFREKEGSTPIVRLLDNFDDIDVVHQVEDKGWEPFDVHSCGQIATADYRRCLSLIYDESRSYMEELNSVYTRKARLPLADFDKSRSVGFKMRLRPQRRNNLIRLLKTPSFERTTIDILRKHDVVVFITVRQDVFRWALSKYHGDGSGRPGHLQFKLAKGEMERNEIPRIEVDLARLERVVRHCERQIERKKRLLERLVDSGMSAYPLLYEDFCTDQKRFFSDALGHLEITVSDVEMEQALARGTNLEKVHSDDIREFVINADEVLGKFDNRYVRW